MVFINKNHAESAYTFTGSQLIKPVIFITGFLFCLFTESVFMVSPFTAQAAYLPFRPSRGALGNPLCQGALWQGMGAMGGVTFLIKPISSI